MGGSHAHLGTFLESGGWKTWWKTSFKNDEHPKSAEYLYRNIQNKNNIN
jgi:hypothetical protein